MKALAKIAGDSGDERRKAQPKLTTDSEKTGRVTWDKVDGKVSVNGFNADDPLQGQVGDCYFISALAAVAKSNPQLLANAVRTNRDGTYTVTFHERGPKETKTRPVEITIDGSFANFGVRSWLAVNAGVTRMMSAAATPAEIGTMGLQGDIRS